MRKSAPVHVTVYYPNTAEGQRELARRAANVHADMVSGALRRLDCPAQQKLALLDAVIADTKERAAGQDGHSP